MKRQDDQRYSFRELLAAVDFWVRIGLIWSNTLLVGMGLDWLIRTW